MLSFVHWDTITSIINQLFDPGHEPRSTPLERKRHCWPLDQNPSPSSQAKPLQLDISIRITFLHHHFTSNLPGDYPAQIRYKEDSSSLDRCIQTAYNNIALNDYQQHANPLDPQPSPQEQHAEQHERSLLPAPFSKQPIPLPQPGRASPPVTAGS
jgi:hypothetical protein